MPWSEKRKRFYPTFLEEPERFWAKVDVRSEDECWPWLGCFSSTGYGSSGKTDRSHRLAYMIANGPIPSGMVVRHSCDFKPCCNPNHLILGTHGDNSRDMVERGRHYSPFVKAERAKHGLALGGPARRVIA